MRVVNIHATLFLVLTFACSSTKSEPTQSNDSGAATADASHGDAASSTADAGAASDATAGADGGSIDATAPAIAEDADINTLSDADKAELCDWNVGFTGGYGATTDCQVGTRVNPATQAICVATLDYNCPTPVTVGEYESCVLAGVPSQGCDTGQSACRPLECLQ